MENNKYELDMVSIRLVKDAPILSERKINSPGAAVEVMREVLSDMDREIICIINLKTDGTPINAHIASMGAINQTLANPRELMKASILSNAAQIIMLHNHPSGDVIPSKEDTALTDKMLQLTELMGIELIDHLIVGGGSNNCFSFAEQCMLKTASIDYITDYHKLHFHKKTNTKVKPLEKKNPKL